MCSPLLWANTRVCKKIKRGITAVMIISHISCRSKYFFIDKKFPVGWWVRVWPQDGKPPVAVPAALDVNDDVINLDAIEACQDAQTSHRRKCNSLLPSHDAGRRIEAKQIQQLGNRKTVLLPQLLELLSGSHRVDLTNTKILAHDFCPFIIYCLLVGFYYYDKFWNRFFSRIWKFWFVRYILHHYFSNYSLSVPNYQWPNTIDTDTPWIGAFPIQGVSATGFTFQWDPR